MGAGHSRALVVEADSPLHRLPPQCKLAAALGSVVAVVIAPREALWAYAVFGAVVVAVARLGRVPLPTMARRMVVELPLLAFAVALPFAGGGPRTELAGLALSVEGLWAAWNILVKATLGLAAMVVLTATTPVAGLLGGLDRLRVPRAFTAIAGFMVRYVDVIAADLHRLQVARLSRGDDPRWWWQARAVASTAGTLFVRTFERGERVHLAMLSRGYDGTMPSLAAPAPASAWWAAMAVPALVATMTGAAWMLR